MDFDLFKVLTKFPFIHEKTFFDSAELRQNKTCEKCIEKDCLTAFNMANHMSEYICSKQYNNIYLKVGNLEIILNGLIYLTNRLVPKGRIDVRKDWIVDKNDVLIFVRKIEEIEKHLIDRVNETIEKNFSIFHDFKTSMSIFYNCTQSIINDLPGNTFEEKLKGSGKSYQDLYNSLELITSQLGMVDVIINPQSIVFGRQRAVNLYRLFEKIKILFGHHLMKKRDVTINLDKEGRWIRDCMCYESIEFIPLILLDNAVKYSVPDSEIIVKFEQSYNLLKIIVKSIGPVVKKDNREKIFEKFFRDETAEQFSRQGIGMGLWIAQQILYAHNSKLFYYHDPNQTGPIGLNVFQFELLTT